MFKCVYYHTVCCLYLKKSINVTYHINCPKKKNHIILSIGAEKAHHKIPYPFMIKNSQKTKMEGNFSLIYKKTLATIIINDKRLNTFTLK